MKNARAQNPFPGRVTKDGYQRISGTCSFYDSVRLVTGNLMQNVTVVNVPTVGWPLKFQLTYNLQDTAVPTYPPVGSQWRHNYMMSLIPNSPPGQTTFISETGRQYNFTSTSGIWSLDADSYYINATLEYNSLTTNWTLVFPNGSYYQFNSSGVLTYLVDAHGNTTSLTYSSGLLTTITEPTGRQIKLGYGGYDGTLITSIADPNSIADPTTNPPTTLGYDGITYRNLTTVTSPLGCVQTFTYGTPSNHQITSRQDPDLNTYTYTYVLAPGSTTVYCLNTVEDAESPTHNTISYSYTLMPQPPATPPPPTAEAISDVGNYLNGQHTLLTDAKGNVWEYRFDNSGNLWRVIEPPDSITSSHQQHYLWDAGDKLLNIEAGFPPPPIVDAVRENSYNSLQRFTYDMAGSGGTSLGNLLYSYDPTGVVTQYTYDANRNVTSIYPGQANTGVQGNWRQQFGADGYVLCAFDQVSGTNDVSSYPTYVSSVSHTTVTQKQVGYPAEIDPRVTDAPDAKGRQAGYWQNNPSFVVTVDVTTAHSFNLSFYTNSADLGMYSASPLTYQEQGGHELQFTVTDATSTQTFHVYNDAPGVWVTFPVTATPGSPVTITVQAGINTPTMASISAMAFDPYNSRKQSFTYNGTNDLLTATDGLGNVMSYTYNANGTLATATDPRGNVTQFFYQDAHLNLTLIQDPLGNQTRFTYDLNGNMQTREDANLNTWTYTYDAKNRLASIEEPSPLLNLTQLSYDHAGNLQTITDANLVVTTFYYSPSNRLSKISQTLSGSPINTLFSYDPNGNLASVTDALSRVTSFSYDVADNLISTTRADGTIVQQAFDALDRVRAITTPNGTNPVLGNITVTNAANFVRNAGFETADPYTSGQSASWTSTGTAARDTTIAHSGTASESLVANSSAPYIQQASLPLPSGAQALLSYWARPDGSANTITVSASAVLQTVSGGNSTTTSANTTLPANSTAWVQTSPFAFSVPGDGQYPRFPMDALQLSASNSSATPTVHFDDVQLNSLSTAYTYDTAGRLNTVQSPDGSQVLLNRDRFGRVTVTTDPRGQNWALAYDTLDRVISMTDPLGNTTQMQYDSAGNLVASIDGDNNTTQYVYDSLNRLAQITYPDATTELFTYDPAGNLHSYTNNRGQQRVLSYDQASRLTQVLYDTDSSTVLYTYDPTDRLKTRTDRNGDVTTLTYDALYRVTDVSHVPGGSSPSAAWSFVNTFDNVGNRTQFNMGGSSGWTVPATPGYDSMNRALAYQDSAGNQTGFQYDVEGRCTQITYPNGSPAVTTKATYDVVGHLLAVSTLQGATNVMSLLYSYDLASNRTSLTTATDNFDYDVDADSRLVNEHTNRFVQRSLASFQLGTSTPQGTDTGIEVDAGIGGVSILDMNDSFSGSLINADRWRIAYSNPAMLGFEIRQNNGLQLAGPRGFFQLLRAGTPTIYDSFGEYNPAVWAGVENRSLLIGDFDIQVDFNNYMASSTSGTADVGIRVDDQPFEQAVASPANSVFLRRTLTGYQADVWIASVHQTPASLTSGDRGGKLRITRTGSSVSTYYDAAGVWTQLGTSLTVSSVNLYVSLCANNLQAEVSGAFNNFYRVPATSQLPFTGTYTSPVYNAGQSVTWDTLTWQASSGGSVQFAVAVSSSPTGPWTYEGPTGPGSYFTTSGQSFATPPTGQYATYQAYFTSTSTLAVYGTGDFDTNVFSWQAPVVSRVDLLYSGTNPTSECQYTYDGAGNVLTKVTETTAGSGTVVTETRTVNDLNQFTANAVNTVVTSPPANTTVNWAYTYDDSGNMLSRSNGTTITLYSWDEDNRLLQVGQAAVPNPLGWDSATWQTPGTGIWDGDVTVLATYTYDRQGRMLTRVDSSGTTTFVWDGMNCVQENAPGGVVTRYYVPGRRRGIGRIMSFDRTVSGVTSVYQVHADALGSIRKVTNSSGTAVATYDYDAWGNLLSGTFSESIPNGGLQYRFVGSKGVRWDAATGLYYMRNRWYDPTLQRFLSRDPKRKTPYAYANNKPTVLTDASGLQADGGWGPLATASSIGAAHAAMDARGMNEVDCGGFQWQEPNMALLGVAGAALGVAALLPVIAPVIILAGGGEILAGAGTAGAIGMMGGGGGSPLPPGDVGAAEGEAGALAGGGGGDTPALFHYSTDEGIAGINTPPTQIDPSQNKLYPNAVYFTTTTPDQAQALGQNAFAKSLFVTASEENLAKTSSWVQVDPTGLNLQSDFPGTYYVETDSPLPVNILDTGQINWSGP